jgi:hypothetical protein
MQNGRKTNMNRRQQRPARRRLLPATAAGHRENVRGGCRNRPRADERAEWIEIAGRLHARKHL